jgi:hypothetical protein
MKPDVSVLVLCKVELNSKFNIPENISILEKYGFEILLVDNDLKPHLKYYHIMRKYPDSIVITVDDDCYYDRNVVSSFDVVRCYILLKFYQLKHSTLIILKNIP